MKDIMIENKDYREIVKAGGADHAHVLYTKNGKFVAAGRYSLSRIWYSLAGWSKDKTVVSTAVSKFFTNPNFSTELNRPENDQEAVWSELQVMELSLRFSKNGGTEYFSETMKSLKKRCAQAARDALPIPQNSEKDSSPASSPISSAPRTPSSCSSSSSPSPKSMSVSSSQLEGSSSTSISRSSSVSSDFIERISSKVSMVPGELHMSPQMYFTQKWVPFLSQKGYSTQEIDCLWTKAAAIPKLDIKWLNRSIEYHLASTKVQERFFTLFSMEIDARRMMIAADEYYSSPDPEVRARAEAILERRSDDPKTKAKNLKYWTVAYKPESNHPSNESLQYRAEQIYGLTEQDWKNWDWNTLLTIGNLEIFAAKLDRLARESMIAKYEPVFNTVRKYLEPEAAELRIDEFRQQLDRLYDLHLNQAYHDEAHRFGPGGRILDAVWELIADTFFFGDVAKDAKNFSPNDLQNIQSVNDCVASYMVESALAKEKDLKRVISEKKDETRIASNIPSAFHENYYIDPKMRDAAIEGHLEFLKNAIRGKAVQFDGKAVQFNNGKVAFDNVVIDFTIALKDIYDQRFRKSDGNRSSVATDTPFGSSREESHAIWRAAVDAILPDLKRMVPRLRSSLEEAMYNAFDKRQSILPEQMEKAMNGFISKPLDHFKTNSHQQKKYDFTAKLDSPPQFRGLNEDRRMLRRERHERIVTQKLQDDYQQFISQ